MEKEKYYTPSIEEFHVGFEYEFKHPDYEKWDKYDTPEFNFEREDCVPFNGNLDCFRVKYLDREDIENFGFDKLGDYDIYNKTIYINGRFCGLDLIYNEDNNYLSIQISQNTSFSGTIKNKSELSKLLKQLNIK